MNRVLGAHRRCGPTPQEACLWFGHATQADVGRPISRKRATMQFEAIVFDFDYTLADSSRGVVKCANHALRDLGLPSAAPEAICATIGLSLTDTFLKLAGRQHAPQSQQFAARYKYHADQEMANLTFLYPTVDSLAHFLRQRSIKLGIVSTKFRYRIESILRRDNLEGVFDVIVGGEDVSSHKPDPEGLRRAITDLRCSSHSTLYVGDSTVDAETAVRANVPFLAVLSGVTTGTGFDGYPAIGIVESVSELPKLLSL